MILLRVLVCRRFSTPAGDVAKHISLIIHYDIEHSVHGQPNSVRWIGGGTLFLMAWSLGHLHLILHSDYSTKTVVRRNLSYTICTPHLSLLLHVSVPKVFFVSNQALWEQHIISIDSPASLDSHDALHSHIPAHQFVSPTVCYAIRSHSCHYLFLCRQRGY